MTSTVTTDRLLNLAPKFHTLPTGEPHTHGLSDYVLKFIDRKTRPGMVTIETGAGFSTTVFAANGCQHTCVVPDSDQVERIRDFCESQAISLSSVTFHTDTSQNVLPKLGNDPIDLGLIDGSHSFPVTFLDYFFIASRLKVGGLLIVDNTNIWTGDVLKRFLLAEPGWTCVEDFPITTVFQKSSTVDLDRDWPDQPYVRRKTYYLIARGKLRVAMRHLRRGEFGQLARKTFKHLLFKNAPLMHRAR